MANGQNRVADFLNSAAGRWLLIAARVVLGAVFVYAAYSKLHFDGRWHLGDYQFFFAMGINSYDIFPLWITQLAARVVPWIELVLGAMMIVGILLRWVSVAITALLVVFMIMLARAALLHLEINCGCFGINSVKPADELMRDSAFMVLALLVTAGAFLSRRSQRATA
jgi:uncharacterized membrane protein YphA (DoxX/SURF4 family)